MTEQHLTGYPSIDKPWLKYYTEEAIHAPLPKCTAFEHIFQANSQYPEDMAIIYYGRKISYGELFQNIESASKAFSALGVKNGDIVIISAANIPEVIYCFYALNRLGAIVNMVDPRTDLDGTHHYIEEVNARLVVCIDAVYPRIVKAIPGTEVRDVVVISPADSLPQPTKLLYRLKNKAPMLDGNAMPWADFLKHGCHATISNASYEPDTVCVIAHTGGTTGSPKGVMLTNDNMNAVTHFYRHTAIPFKRQQRYFNDLPPFIMYGLVIGIHTALSYGQQVITYPIFDSANFPKQFAKYKPQHFSALPDHLYYLVEHSATKNMQLDFLITPAVGGDAVNTQLEERVNRHFSAYGCQFEVCKGYGMTELAATACTTFPGANAVGSVGVPMVSNVFKIMDTDSGEELPYNQSGEIWISGPSIMKGYYNNPEPTNDLIHTDPDGTRWVRTGDLGRINEDGLVFHEGRIRRIYLTDFENQPAKIFPLLVEREIVECADVEACCVVGRMRQNSACYEPVAFVIKAQCDMNADQLTAQLTELCEQSLPSYMQPVEYRYLDELPHTPIGKVDFRKLEEMAAQLTVN